MTATKNLSGMSDAQAQAFLDNSLGPNFGTTESPERDFQKAITSFVEGCKAIHKKGLEELGCTQPYDAKWELNYGPRYVRVVRADPQRSVHCFVERSTGAVLKAEGWKKPAKHARGNIYDDKNGLGRMDRFGPAYLR